MLALWGGAGTWRDGDDAAPATPVDGGWEGLAVRLGPELTDLSAHTHHRHLNHTHLNTVLLQPQLVHWGRSTAVNPAAGATGPDLTGSSGLAPLDHSRAETDPTSLNWIQWFGLTGSSGVASLDPVERRWILRH